MENTNFKGTIGTVRFVSDFNITNGTEKICELSEYTNQDFSKEKRNENGKLIIDAFNVRQQINFDLLELLKQRNEMLEILEKIVDCQYNPEKTLSNLNKEIHNAKNLIQKSKV